MDFPLSQFDYQKVIPVKYPIKDSLSMIHHH